MLLVWALMVTPFMCRVWACCITVLPEGVWPDVSMARLTTCKDREVIPSPGKICSPSVVHSPLSISGVSYCLVVRISPSPVSTFMPESCSCSSFTWGQPERAQTFRLQYSGSLLRFILAYHYVL